VHAAGPRGRGDGPAFDVKVPNATTVKAMRAADKGKKSD
jgi:hypothetical protein